MAKLGDTCSFQSGGTPSKSEPSFFDGGIPWITTVALNGRHIGDADAVDWITDKAIEKSAAKIVPPFSIMVGTRVGIGKVAINDVPMSTSQDIISLIGIDENVWDKDYLCKLISSKSEYLNSQARGATIKGIKIETLSQLEVRKISLEEQQQINQRINTIEDIISLRKEQMQKLDDLVKARFVEMFGDPEYNDKKWPVKKLNDLCNIGSSKRIYQEEQSMNGVPFWRISDLVAKMDTGNAESNIYIPESKYDQLKTQGLIPKSGDILVTSRGTLGRCYIVAPNDRFYFQDGMISWLSNYSNEITPLYLQYLFDMTGFRKQIDGLQAGSTVAYLSIAMLKKLDVMLPDIRIQEQYAAFVSTVDKTRLVVHEGLEKLKMVKSALMQEYFGG